MFFLTMAQINAAIQIVTLSDSPFNRSKSNIAYLESSMCGSVCLTPDFQEWLQPGCINYTSTTDFEAKLNTLIEDNNRGAHCLQAQEHIRSNLLLSKINKLRIESIDSLIKS
jgi:hypothetical protein